MSDCLPCIVKKLGESVGMTPLDWTEYPDRIVIVFVEGPKLTFTREPETLPTQQQQPTKKKKAAKKK